MKNYIIIFIALALSVSNLVSFKSTKKLKINIVEETSPTSSNLTLKQSLNSVTAF